MVTETPACVHHWVIETPDEVLGSVFSPGVCKLCGDKRKFRNVSRTGKTWSGKDRTAAAKPTRQERSKRPIRLRSTPFQDDFNTQDTNQSYEEEV